MTTSTDKDPEREQTSEQPKYQIVCLNPDCGEQYQTQHPVENCDICGIEDIEVTKL